jgi:hypothetical protein
MSDPIDTGEAQKTIGLKRYSLGNIAKEKKLDLDSMKLDELLALRDEIDAKLPSTAIKDLDLSQELVFQFLRGKQLQTTIAQDENVPANQRAQIANSVRAALTELVKLQQSMYGTEQCRRIEAALAKALRTLPEEAQRVFYDAYQREAEQMATIVEEKLE